MWLRRFATVVLLLHLSVMSASHFGLQGEGVESVSFRPVFSEMRTIKRENGETSKRNLPQNDLPRRSSNERCVLLEASSLVWRWGLGWVQIVGKGRKNVQGSAKERSLGCVNPASWLPLSTEGKFTQPRNHSFADLCIYLSYSFRFESDAAFSI